MTSSAGLGLSTTSGDGKGPGGPMSLDGTVLSDQPEILDAGGVPVAAALTSPSSSSAAAAMARVSMQQRTLTASSTMVAAPPHGHPGVGSPSHAGMADVGRGMREMSLGDEDGRLDGRDSLGASLMTGSAFGFEMEMPAGGGAVPPHPVAASASLGAPPTGSVASQDAMWGARRLSTLGATSEDQRGHLGGAAAASAAWGLEDEVRGDPLASLASGPSVPGLLPPHQSAEETRADSYGESAGSTGLPAGSLGLG